MKFAWLQRHHRRRVLKGVLGRRLTLLRVLIPISSIALAHSSYGNSMPRTYPFSECSTVAEALPDLVIAAQVPRTAIAYYGNSALAIRDQAQDGLLCEHGCRVSALLAKDRLQQYNLAGREAAVARDREYKTIGGTAVYRSIFFKMEGKRWLTLEIQFLDRDDGGRTYEGMKIDAWEVPELVRASDKVTKLGSCLERP